MKHIGIILWETDDSNFIRISLNQNILYNPSLKYPCIWSQIIINLYPRENLVFVYKYCHINHKRSNQLTIWLLPKWRQLQATYSHLQVSSGSCLWTKISFFFPILSRPLHFIQRKVCKWQKQKEGSSMFL